MKTLSKLDIAILHNLSDDWECPATICPEVQRIVDGASRQNVLNSLYELFRSELIKLMQGGALSREALMSEAEGDFDTPHWFGLTEAGSAALETESESHRDWSKAWVFRPDFDARDGHIEGANREACMEALKKLSGSSAMKLRVDWATLKHSEVPEFRPKLYKTLQKGHRIDFKMEAGSRIRAEAKSDRIIKTKSSEDRLTR